jgi:hypothetical protein
MSLSMIFGILGGGFLAAAVLRLRRDRGLRAASRTWFLIGIIFSVASLWPRAD